jgi:hypothetical protein
MRIVGMVITGAVVLFAALGFTVYAQGDITAPVLAELTIEPSWVDTSTGPQTITVTVSLTDDLSGVSYGELQFRPAVGTTQYFVIFLDDRNIVSGDGFHNIYVATHTMPQYAAEGRWELSFAGTTDNVGNVAHYTEESDPLLIYRYFVNREDSEPEPVPEPTPYPTVAPTPVPTPEPQLSNHAVYIPSLITN